MLNLLIALTHCATGIVIAAAFVRALHVKGVQWWAYVGYTVSGLVWIGYGAYTGQMNIVFNSGVLMLTNGIGLYTWWKK